MGLIVFAVLKSGEWGWFLPSEDAPTIFGMSSVVWLIVTGLVTLRLFGTHIRRLDQEGKEPLFSPSLIDQGLNGGLLMFLFQFIVMMGVFFVLPLFLSVALGLSAIETGLRITPLSVTMLLAAAGVPKFYPAASPRRVVTLGFVAVLIGIVALIGAMDVDASASIVTVPLLVIGLGLGALASQLGAVTVSAAPEELSPEVGGLQNTASQFGASLGTALAGSVMIAALTASFLGLIAVNPDVPADVSDQATTELASGIPFISDQDLEAALDASSLDDETTDAILEDYGQARLEGIRTALSLLAVFAVIALFFTRRIPDRPPAPRLRRPSDAQSPFPRTLPLLDAVGDDDQPFGGRESRVARREDQGGVARLREHRVAGGRIPDGGVMTLRVTRYSKTPYSVASTMRSPSRSSFRDQNGAP